MNYTTLPAKFCGLNPSGSDGIDVRARCSSFCFFSLLLYFFSPARESDRVVRSTVCTYARYGRRYGVGVYRRTRVTAFVTRP